MKLYRENNFVKLKSQFLLPKKMLKVGTLLICFNLLGCMTIGDTDHQLIKKQEADLLSYANETRIIKENHSQKIEYHKEAEKIRKAEYNRLQGYKMLIEEYSNYYNVDSSKAWDIALRLTNSFRSEDYLRTKNIGKSQLYEDVLAFESVKIGAIVFVRDLSKNSERYTKENITLDTEYKNEMSNEQFIGYISDIFKIDKTLVLALIYHESGRFTSPAFIEKNNPGGLMGSDGPMQYRTKEEGMIETVLNLYHKFYLNDNECTIEEIQSIYAPIGAKNDPNNLNENWLSGVTSIMEEIKNDDDLFISRGGSMVLKR